jgi:hypothetical protein
MTIADKIWIAIAEKVATSRSIQFSPKDIRDLTDLKSGSFGPIFQGMRSDQPGGAPPVPPKYKNTLVQVSRGKYRLSANGQSLVTPKNKVALPDDVSDIELIEDAGDVEGRRRLVQHFQIERKPSVVRDAKRKWAALDPLLRCVCCKFSFKERFGKRGEDFVEAHHKKPFADLKRDEIVRTAVQDLVPVCANCHRMLHKKPAVSLEELATLGKVTY